MSELMQKTFSGTLKVSGSTIEELEELRNMLLNVLQLSQKGPELTFIFSLQLGKNERKEQKMIKRGDSSRSEEILKILKDIRLALNAGSMRDFCRETGLSRSTVYHWLKNPSMISYASLRQLRDIAPNQELKARVDALLCE